MFKLIVGLGNPGIKYRWTRHNLGFLVVEEFAKQRGIVWKRQRIFTPLEKASDKSGKDMKPVRNKVSNAVRKSSLTGFNAYVGQREIEKERVILCKPLTYVNCSGEAVKEIAAKYNIDNRDILVICDDLNLPLGKIRIRAKGSDGGHNGLKSIIDCLGTKEFGLVRIGISKSPVTNPQSPVTDYVLGKFTREEKKIVKEVIAKAAQAIETVIKEGIEKAMNEYNATGYRSQVASQRRRKSEEKRPES